MNDFIDKRSIGIGFLLLCVGLFLAAAPPASAQWMGYANFTFKGTYTCADENGYTPLGSRYPDSLGAHVEWTTGMFRTGDDTTGFGLANGWSGPVCIATTSSNNKYNSKNWSPQIDYASYQAAIGSNPKAATYIFWVVQMDPGYYLTPVSGGPDIYIHFMGKKNGSGPDQGYMEVLFWDASGNQYGPYQMTGMNTWSPGNVWLNTNSSQKEFRFSYDNLPVDTYVRAEFRLHAFNQSSSGGQGDGFQIEGVVTLGPDNPSPVQLVSFTSTLNGGRVDLKWKTATEINNYGFEVQRSTDSKSWNPIGFVDGKGTVNTPQIYSFSDPLTPDLLKAPAIYYRLRQIDRDGTQEFSAIVQVSTRVATGVRLMGNYPNPFNPSTTILFSLDRKMPVSLIVYDLRGAEVARLVNNETLDAGVHSVVFLPSSLASGTYLYTLSTPGMNLHSVMQIMK